MNRRCDFHFELEISTYMICWQPSTKIIAENLVSAKIKVLLTLGLPFLVSCLFFSNFNWFYFSNIFEHFNHHFGNLKLKTVFKLNLLFSSFAICYFDENICEKGGQSFISCFLCKSLMMLPFPQILKEKYRHFLLPSFLIGLIQWPFKINGNSSALS